MRAALYACLAAAPAWAADGVPFELLPPDTNAVLGISVRSLIDSPIVRSFGADFHAMAGSFTAAHPLGGLDPTKDLDSVVIAMAGETDNGPSLVVARGRFDRVPTADAKPYHGVPVFDQAGGKESFALLDGGTALAGSPVEVRAAIDRRGGAAQVDGELRRRVESLSGAYEFWAAGDAAKGMRMPSTAKGLDAVDQFEIGASLRQGLELRGRIHLRSAEDAAQLASALGMFEMMLKMQPKQADGTKFDLRTSDGYIEIELAIPEAELKKAFTAQKDLVAGMLKSQMQMPMPMTAQQPGMETAAAPPPPVARPAAARPARSGGIPISHPATSPGSIVTNERGETTLVTLPGK
jgi:hypothetical protein